MSPSPTMAPCEPFTHTLHGRRRTASVPEFERCRWCLFPTALRPFAIAAAQGIDYLITWNFKHINNASTRTMVVNTVSSFGLVCPVLCSPEELMGEEDA